MTRTALIRLSGFDAPLDGAPDVAEVQMRVLRRVDVDGMEEVLLAELLSPLDTASGRVTHVAVSPRFAGDTLDDAPFGGKVANLAFVTRADPAAATALTPADVRLAGFGLAQGIPRAAPTGAPPSAKRGWLARLLGRAA
ncbi:hypothetical protein JQC91_05345 [Jannaschia sp. Os4]|uniref:hypothetical protein n=1 Tax=Jannaschia sp. Os4 TaxID=2807617 RepID=UPI001939ED9D|nr:hypothetical protein [Jannaschia sp. Os4]MBM2575724.1 hypothetical protein [Jannaschia sp. Os4]